MVTFWQTNVAIPGAEDLGPMPDIPGTAAGSADQNIENANALFPLLPYLDGSEVVSFLPSPFVNSDNQPIDLADVDPATITPETFLGLHLAHQLELLLRNGGSLTLNGQSPDERLDVVAGSDGSSVLVLQQLSKTDVMRLNQEDQSRIKGHLDTTNVSHSYLAFLAASWGVSMVEGSSRFAGEAEVAALVDATINWVNSHRDFRPPTGHPDTYKDIYIEQLELLKEQASGKSFVSISDLNDQIAAIRERCERVVEFTTFVRHQRFITEDAADDSIWLDYSSLDNNKVIAAGLENFLAQERRILQVKQQRQSLFQNSAGMDLATLISALQLTYNIQKEAEVAIMTEELQQQNALLRDYAEMQRMVNDVLKEFTGDDASTQVRNITGSTGEILDNVDGSGPSDFSVRERRAVIMFSEDFSGAAEGEKHPLEVLRGIERPLHNEADAGILAGPVIKYQPFTQSAWNLFSTQLADSVTLINQQSQILTNDISSSNQEKNRHYDLANGSLRRLNDLLTTISRS